MKTSGVRKKIINDPVHGFITVSGDLLLRIIEHPYFQRLRRIKQLGLTHLVYPGAMHTRFHHAVGAMFLMDEAVKSLRQKGHEITADESLAARAAILMHDIGHGPFSHALEHSVVDEVSHEDISLMMMHKLNNDFGGELTTAIEIFRGSYHKRFLSQLISSQLDVDRMDYLRRDSFYTGVSEGVIGTQRILKMLDVRNDSLAVEVKGIYSIDNFLNSRRIMFWQVYLHKTVLSAEFTLINILKRARYLAENGEKLFATPALYYFLYTGRGKADFENSPECLENFAALDDFDILSAIKVWKNHDDKILADLCDRIINRRLLKIELRNTPFEPAEVEQLKTKAIKRLPFVSVSPELYVFSGKSENHSYDITRNNINILLKNGDVKDLSRVSDQWKTDSGGFVTEKYFLCFPEGVK